MTEKTKFWQAGYDANIADQPEKPPYFTGLANQEWLLGYQEARDDLEKADQKHAAMMMQR